jgi:hypothetical protein
MSYDKNGKPITYGPHAVPPQGASELKAMLGMDGTERLCRTLYGRDPIASDFLGGSNAKMLHDAADKLQELKIAVWNARAQNEGSIVAVFESDWDRILRAANA